MGSQQKNNQAACSWHAFAPDGRRQLKLLALHLASKSRFKNVGFASCSNKLDKKGQTQNLKSFGRALRSGQLNSLGYESIVFNSIVM
jgi:hypothetical protein